MIEFNASLLPAFPADLTIYDMLIDIIPLLAVASAIFYYVFISRNTIKNRKAQLFMQLYDHFHKTEFMKQNIYIMNLEWKDFDDYWKKYGAVANPETSSVIHSVGNYFEGVGLLVKRRLIDIDLVDELMTGLVTRYWEKMGPIIVEQRVLFNWPEAYEWTEYLYNEIKSISEKKRPKASK